MMAVYGYGSGTMAVFGFAPNVGIPENAHAIAVSLEASVTVAIGAEATTTLSPEDEATQTLTPLRDRG